MSTLLLVIIYVSFISLGLPDAILGSAWPVMYQDFSAPISFAGVVGMLISVGTIVSSLFSSYFLNRYSTGTVTTVSVSLTAVSLLGFSFASTPLHLCLLAIPYGLGAGSVDAGLNNFVAVNYKSRHMSWLHCFWGLGASIGPYVMGFVLANSLSWTVGYRAVAIFQCILTVILIASIPLFKQKQALLQQQSEIPQKNNVGILQAVKLKNAKYRMLIFFSYCSLEATTGLWASSYLVLYKGFEETLAAKLASLYYLGIMLGRFLSGFISDYFGNKNMVRGGQIIAFFSILMLLLPLGDFVSMAGLLLIGFGSAPVFPCLIHETPKTFGVENSQTIIGLQMSSAYTGISLMPPLFGLLAQNTSFGLYPFYLLIFAITMFLLSEKVNFSCRNNIKS